MNLKDRMTSIKSQINASLDAEIKKIEETFDQLTDKERESILTAFKTSLASCKAFSTKGIEPLIDRIEKLIKKLENGSENNNTGSAV